MIRQAFTQLVSTIIKELLTSDNKDLTKRLSLKLVESIYYHYSPKKPVVETAQIIRIIIIETKGFAAKSTPYIIFVNLKKEEKKK